MAWYVIVNAYKATSKVVKVDNGHVPFQKLAGATHGYGPMKEKIMAQMWTVAWRRGCRDGLKWAKARKAVR